MVAETQISALQKQQRGLCIIRVSHYEEPLIHITQYPCNTLDGAIRMPARRVLARRLMARGMIITRTSSFTAEVFYQNEVTHLAKTNKVCMLNTVLSCGPQMA